MSILKDILKKEKNTNASIIIDCKEDAVTINNVVVSFPTHINTLIEIFGEPTKQKHEYLGWYVVWDKLGVFLDCGTMSAIFSIKFLKSKQHKLKHYPNQFFKGKILVDNKEIQNTDFKTIEVLKHSINLLTYKGEKQPYAISIGENFNYKEDISKDKYAVKPLDEEVIEFKDFNFKLSIIQILMYEKELLKPKFDVYEFVKHYDKRKINIEEEGYKRIPEVTQYFKDLPIPKRLAAEVIEIYQDGGDEIYLQMLRYGNGSEDCFDIKSAEDAKNFPNLKKAVLCYATKNVLDEFNQMGIQAKWL